MTIQDKIEQKRAECAKLEAEQQRLWEANQVAETAYKVNFLNPWCDAYTKQNKALEELKALESIAKEL